MGNKLRVGIVTCVAMDKMVRSWLDERGVNGCVYPVTNSCFYDVRKEMLVYHVERAILENGFCILNYGRCHPFVSEIQKLYGDKLVTIQSDNCYEMMLGRELYRQRADSGHIFRHPLSMKCWKEMPPLQEHAGGGNVYPADITFILEKGSREEASSYIAAMQKTSGQSYRSEVVEPQNQYLFEKLDAAYDALEQINHNAAGYDEAHPPFSFHNYKEFYYILDSHQQTVFHSQVSDKALFEGACQLLRIFKDLPGVTYSLKNTAAALDKRQAYLSECVSFTNRDVLSTEYELSDGQNSLWIHETVWVSYDEESKLQNIYGRMENITDIKISEQKIAAGYDTERALRKQLEDENLIQRNYLKALVHEIRTPLTPLIAASDALVAYCAEDNSISSLVRAIQDGAEMLNLRINELFELEKGRNGLMKLNMGDYNLGQLMEDLQIQFEPLARKQNKKILFNFDDQESIMICDQQRLRQVFTNLVDNALKYTVAGDTIEIKAARQGAFVYFSVIDSGSGISNEKACRLFSSYRDFQPSDNLSGLGLGLPLVKLYVQAHGGDIKYLPAEGKGSIFTFTIPAAGRNI